MKRRFLLTILFVFILLLSTGCDKSHEDPKTKFEKMIMVEGEIWKNTGFAMTVQVNEDEIIGEITSTVKDSKIPTENDQANFEIKGSKYSLYGKDIVVSINNQWILFLKEENWSKYDKPINSVVSIDYSSLDENVFNDLSNEEIDNLLIDIANEIYKDEDYESNLDSIIENVFKEYGVDISSNLEDVKSALIISKPNTN